ncbi:MAG: 50S ribosomal protein L3 [Candidatus Aenigmarchaeota archaeon]|nr:50S ribosomal protein L3 [Candidatus Aenigmarchaeota archaeon]
MGAPHGPRRGSTQFWPRVRARRIYPRISTWSGSGLQGFAAYKVGMVQYSANETRKNVNYGKDIVKPATVLEIPPVYPIAITFYRKGVRGKRKVGTLFDVKALPKELKKDLKRQFSYKKEDGGKVPESYDEIRLQVSMFPRKIGLKKTPEIFEVGTDFDLEKAKAALGKELKIGEAFAEGDFINVTAITTGKGTAGPVKRFGVKRRNHHSKKGRRRIGTMGPTTPRKVLRTVPRAGQLGFGKRTEINKLILKISDKPEEVNPMAGFTGYGIVKGSYLLVDGSVPGHKNRLVVLRKQAKPNKAPLAVAEILK